MIKVGFRLFVVALLGLSLASPAMAAGTVTIGEITTTSAKRIVFTWTSSAGGAADGTTVFAAFDGKLVGFTTDPGATAPTDNYDITIVDADGYDVLLGQGTDRDTANTEHVATDLLGAVAGSSLTLHVTNAGATKQGVVILWIR